MQFQDLKVGSIFRSSQNDKWFFEKTATNACRCHSLISGEKLHRFMVGLEQRVNYDLEVFLVKKSTRVTIRI